MRRLYLPECQPAAFTGATISPCGRYRYSLKRQWGPLDADGPVVWIMLNPSTADADTDDPTIRACREFSRRWGKSALEVVNLFALRSPKPSALAIDHDPVGPDNDLWIDTAIRRASLVVAAWGAHGTLLGRHWDVKRIIASTGCRARCLGLTKAGQPRHPLYVRRTRDLEWMPQPTQQKGERR